MSDLNPFQIPSSIQELADEVRDFRLANRTDLSRDNRRLLMTRENALRGVATSLAALITQKILERVSNQLKELGSAIEEAQVLLDNLTNLRQALEGIAKVLKLAANIIDILAPVPET